MHTVYQTNSSCPSHLHPTLHPAHWKFGVNEMEVKRVNSPTEVISSELSTFWKPADITIKGIITMAVTCTNDIQINS